MNINKIWASYFSPTGTTQKVADRIAGQLAARLDRPASQFDFTLPKNREKPQQYKDTDLVVFSVPVYAGRVPNVLLKYLNMLEGGGALAVPVVLFGNRHYDDALKELYRILAEHNFRPVAAAAFVGEHSFSYILGAGRPDSEDMTVVDGFADRLADKLIKGDYTFNFKEEDGTPLKNYYQPQDRDGNAIDIRKVRPKTNDMCRRCGLCVKKCPMGAIDPENIEDFLNICIKCGACSKKCPSKARYFDDENYLYHKTELEEVYTRRAEPDIFI